MVDKFEIINTLLLREPDQTGELSIFVHKTVVREFCKMWRNISKKVKWTIFKYPLRIGDKCYDMRIINITLSNSTKFHILRKLIRNAQFSFPREENIALFIDAKSFRILEDFIKQNNLESYILQINKKTGIASNDDTIKEVIFHQSAKALNLVEKYRTHLIFNDRYSYPQPQYYYMAFGFPWLQPPMMKHFKIRLTFDELYFERVLSIIFKHIGTHKYNYDLNIFELLTLRLAMCDYRSPSTSNSIKYELDFMIKRELSKIIENDVFDTGKYLIARNYPQQDLLICYLAYEHQNNLRAISFNTGINLKPDFRSAKVRHTIVLTMHESDALNIIRKNRNVMYCVDGLGYHRMSLSFFLDLFERENVEKIILDTNFRWVTDVCNLHRVITNSYEFRDVHFIGSNTFNFIEHFVTSFKLVSFGGYDGTILKITCSLKDYSIFKNMRVYQIIFSNIQIDADMIIGLYLSELRLRCNDCTFENKFRNWALLNKFSGYCNVEILEDEGTWQSMFEFISQFLINNNYKEFQFVSKTICIKSNHNTNAPGSRVQLGNIIFKLDALSSKLEICSSNNEILDLYDIKFGRSPSDKTDYDFYQ